MSQEEKKKELENKIWTICFEPDLDLSQRNSLFNDVLLGFGVAARLETVFIGSDDKVHCSIKGANLEEAEKAAKIFYLLLNSFVDPNAVGVKRSIRELVDLCSITLH